MDEKWQRGKETWHANCHDKTTKKSAKCWYFLLNKYFFTQKIKFFLINLKNCFKFNKL